MKCLIAALFALVCAIAAPAAAQTAPFDLTGPSLRIQVTHAGQTLPISRVPNLSAGDRLSIKAELPADQSAHYLLVAAFLRGATNPPPKDWFFQAETWTKKGRDGLSITVPTGARQIILFLAPQTGGDFKTLVDAVRGRPGAFVRAAQDLNQAALDRARLDSFLGAIHRLDPGDPARFEAVPPLLARSLAIKLNTDCLQRQVDLQAACLTQNRDSLVLSDGHSATITEALAGTPADLAMQIAATPQGGLGYYSPYIAVVRDVVRILGAFQTAQYQYIPALGLIRDDLIGLLLNAAPSFHSPYSVLVTALPMVDAPQIPPLRAARPDPLCIAAPGLTLLVEGAPLVYATPFAHNMALRLKRRDGTTIDLPARADAEAGGYRIDTAGLDLATLPPTAQGVLHGRWGFTAFDGPAFRLQTPTGWNWSPGGGSAVVGRVDAVTLAGGAATCVEGVSLRHPSGRIEPVTWSANAAGDLTIKLPLEKARPGAATLLIATTGQATPATLPLTLFNEASAIDALTLRPGDMEGELTGARLDAVARVTVGDLAFTPGALTRRDGRDHLSLVTPAPVSLTQGETAPAKVTLKDGRVLTTTATIAAPRLRPEVIARTVARPPSLLTLADETALPHDATLTFSLRADHFDGRETIEVANADGTAVTTLVPGTDIMLQNARTLVATLAPARVFGPSIYGPLRYRVIQAGTPSPWQPLATLVRLPDITRAACSPDGCAITGARLFLIHSAGALTVPEGFTGTSLSVPTPLLHLSDAPAISATLHQTPAQ